MSELEELKGVYDPREGDIDIILDLISRRIIGGLEWAGSDYTECLLPYGVEELRERAREIT